MNCIATRKNIYTVIGITELFLINHKIQVGGCHYGKFQNQPQLENNGKIHLKPCS